MTHQRRGGGPRPAKVRALMMADTSVLLAMLREEPERRSFDAAIEAGAARARRHIRAASPVHGCGVDAHRCRVPSGPPASPRGMIRVPPDRHSGPPSIATSGGREGPDRSAGVTGIGHAHQKHRHRCVSQDVFGVAAEQQAAEPAPPVRATHDQVGRPCARALHHAFPDR